jgi:adenosylcobinamide kinase/adenosylcobinamide-phosphate guanylyltransferase
VVAVGEETGWGIVPAEPGIAAFRELLGNLVQRLAAESERVVLVVAGRVVELL